MATVLIGGGTGLIGSRLSEVLSQEGYTVLHLSRHKRPGSTYKTFQWDVAKGEIEEEAIQSADYVINLAGAGIADKPWTKARKQLIIESRVRSTALLHQSFERLEHRPKAYISSSAIGYYGNRGEELLKEASVPGDGFLSESTKAWEDSVRPIAESGIRTCLVRTGIVLSTQGGALEKMLIPLKLGMATYFGSGRQWYSWIHIDDICGIYKWLLESATADGVYNGVAPQPARNKQLTEELKDAYSGASVLLPAPAFALKLGMGEMSHVVLDSAKVSADKIVQAGYTFEYPQLNDALRDLLVRKI